jgi:ABC-2 type transport system ATP-binding protein
MLIHIDQLTKVYGQQKAIDDLNFEVRPGEILGFLGPNGAGKTTTMKIITCYMPPTSGTVTMGAYNIHEHPLEIRSKIGYLPEHNPLYLDMYVKEFLQFVSQVYKLPKATQKQRIAEVIEMTGLGREQNKKIGALSKGYRQRVGLSQALIHNPEVLILDEPTSGLDPNQIVEIRNLIKEVGKDKTVIFSSHILSEVEAIADRVIIIDKGQIVADSDDAGIQSLSSDEALIQLELGEEGMDLSSIEGMAGVREIENISPTLFVIHTDKEAEIRKAIFDACVEKGNFIVSLNKETFSLEDAFRKLTAEKV